MWRAFESLLPLVFADSICLWGQAAYDYLFQIWIVPFCVNRLGIFFATRINICNIFDGIFICWRANNS